jgi:hypothetical protein
MSGADLRTSSEVVGNTNESRLKELDEVNGSLGSKTTSKSDVSFDGTKTQTTKTTTEK